MSGIRILQLLKTGLKIIFDESIIHIDEYTKLPDIFNNITEVDKTVLTGDTGLKLSIDWNKHLSDKRQEKERKGFVHHPFSLS